MSVRADTTRFRSGRQWRRLGTAARLEMVCGSYIIDAFFAAEDGTGYVLRTPFESNVRIEGDMPNWNGEE